MYSYEHQYVHDRLHARRVEAARHRLARTAREARPRPPVSAGARQEFGFWLVRVGLRLALDSGRQRS